MSIRKRTWETKDGLKVAWVVDYKHNGKRHLKTFERQKDAKAWWDGQAGHEIAQGTHTPESTSITVAEAGENWVKRAEREGCERSTVRHYRQHLDLHIAPRIGHLKLAKLTTPGIEKVRDDLLDNLSRPLAKKVLTSLKSLLSEAQRRGDVAQNVALPVKIKRSKRDEHKLEVGVDLPGPDEIRKIIDAAEGRWRPFLITAIFTGLRSSELRGLPWKDVDFKKRVIHVRQRADRWQTLGNLKSHAAKRDVPMPPIVINVLKEWRLACPKGELGLVFPSNSGAVQHHSNIDRRGLQATLKACGLGRYGLHTMRHFYASWLINQGFKPKRVQMLLGHSSIQITFDRYGHWFPDEDDDHERLAAGELALVG